MHLGESHTGGKAISPLIAALLSYHAQREDCYPTWCAKMEMELK